MKKILILIVAFAMGIDAVNAAVRDGNSASRTNGGTTTTVQKRVSTTERKKSTTAPRVTVLGNTRNTNTVKNSRTSTQRGTATRNIIQPTKNVTARAATPVSDATSAAETRTGGAYESCKTAFFSCMDQFCSLKNDDYRRCSCSDRVDSLGAARDVLIEAGEQLTIFTENLDTVGMTAAQASSLRTESEGEHALTTDNSASKALLQAIMNAIRGGDTTVGGRYSELNSINLAFDTSIVFGGDASQLVATYNGQRLYSAVYPQCRNAVRSECSDTALQRAVTAYLMAIEQDCNTVQTAIEQKQKEMKSAVREGSALLDLARVENRQKHNTDDITTCINNVEDAILSEEVCGANYHKCLDNGEYIDIATGKPIIGVEKFYELGNLLKFAPGLDAATQRLSKTSGNKVFVNNFEKRTKKFAKPALDKCVEIADTVWEEYLDKAMLAIYYAQQSKVSEIKQGCFDFISQCYESTNVSITAAMAQLTGDNAIILQPDRLSLSTQLCQDYISSCDNMFKTDENADVGIIAEYVQNQQQEDVLAACRAVAKQCFDKYGGTGYENFYYPYSGLFDTGKAPDWFTLYDTDGKTLKSPCAKQLDKISSCRDTDMLKKAFGGFDMFYVEKNPTDNTFTIKNHSDTIEYGIEKPGEEESDPSTLRHRDLRAVGVATEIYNQIIDTLSTQCLNINGRFMPVQTLTQDNIYDTTNYCKWRTFTFDTNVVCSTNSAEIQCLYAGYGIASNENMCPRDYGLSVDVQSWGSCSCWDNGGRRSKNGRTATCVAVLPTETSQDDSTICSSQLGATTTTPTSYHASTDMAVDKWCTQKAVDSHGRVCPYRYFTVKLDANQTPGTTNTLSSYSCATTQFDDSESPEPYFEEMVPESI
ncbi:MAG: hypothetical protein IKP05_03480 [Alphaproteobacteria bacterium]|nr:hypothetical protein [Alphaproteobacteria bacterium]